MTQETPDRSNYIRVSTVLYPFSGLKDVPIDKVETAAHRGTRVHKICEAIVAGLGEFDVDDVTRPYVDSFKQWWSSDAIHILHSEKRFWCDKLQLTGQVDYVMRNPNTGEIYIVDLKTSYKPSKTWQAQAEGYHYLAAENGLQVNGMVFLHLSRTGKHPKLYKYAPKSDLFLKTYDVYKHFYA